MPDLYFIEKYFTEEKIESILFIITGTASILLALFFWLVIKYSLHKGMAYPLVVIGIIQLVVGTTVLSQSSNQLHEVKIMVKENPVKIKTEEIPRIKLILENFTTYKITEIVLIIAGVILFAFFFNSKFPFWKGFGLGLFIQSFIMLALDLTAEDRAIIYLDELLKLTV